jgi:WD40 repeat protein
MKKILFFALLITTFHIDYAMELPASSSKSQTGLVTVTTIDGTIELIQSNYDLLKKYSITMKDYEEYTKEEPKELQLTKNSLTLLIKYLSSLNSDENELINQLNKEKTEDLVIGLKAADYLNVPDVVSFITDELAHRLSSQDFISQFIHNPKKLTNLKLYDSLKNLIAKKIMKKNPQLINFLSSSIKLSPIKGASILKETLTRQFVFNTDSSVIAFVSFKTGKNNVNLYDTSTGALLHIIDRDSFGDRIYQIVFSPDGTLLAIANGDSCFLYSATTYKLIEKIKTPSFAVAFTSDSKKLAIADKKSVQIWDFEQKKIVSSLSYEEHVPVEFSIKKITFSSNNQTLGIWFDQKQHSENTFIVIWHLDQGTLDSINAGAPFAFSTDSKKIITGKKNIITVWDAQSSKHLMQLTGSTYIHDLSLSPNGLVLASAHTEGIDLWDWQSNEIIKTLHSENINYYVIFDKTGTKIFSIESTGNAVAINKYDLLPLYELLKFLNTSSIDQVLLLLYFYENEKYDQLKSLLPKNIQNLFVFPTQCVIQ